MNISTLLAVVSPKLMSWLTPIWVISMGALAGVLLLVALWGLFRLLSHIPVLGRRPSRPAQTSVRAAYMAVVLTAGWFLFSGNAAADGFGLLISTMAMLVASWCLSYAVLVLCWKQTMDEVIPAVAEGPLLPLAYLVASVALFGVLGVFVAEKPRDVVASLGRLPFTGSQQHVVTLPGPVSEDVEPLMDVPVLFQMQEMREMVITSNGRTSFSYLPFGELVGDPVATVTPEEPFHDRRPDHGMVGDIEDAEVTVIYLRNESGKDTKVTITYRTSPVYSQVRSIPLVAIGIVLVLVFYLVQRMAAPRLSAISLSTLKSEIAQPLFLLAMSFGMVAILIFIWIPYNTFGEDIKMVKDTGLTMIMVLGILVALWAASTSIAEEIDGRTALTVLSKPISRRSFIIGKFMGIAWTTFLLFAFLGVVFMVAVAYKPIFDAKETSTGLPAWQLCYLEMVSVFPGLLLAFMETMVLASLSVAISTRLNMLANFTICMTIYLLGHLTPLVVQSSLSSFDIVRFFGQLIATIFPNLEHFNIQAAVAAGVPVPYEYLGWAFFYCLVYSLIALLLALVMFEDRDLA
jgi:ABC-type transport system involved in multi-copper enzyme maturation permease subunit